MHIHILGICGTFMGSLALIARSLGHRVSGSDQNVYPPMSTLLHEQGIELIDGYDNDLLNPVPDLVIVGNALSRGQAVVERLLNSQIAYTSGPQWLSQALLVDRWVIAVAGTHGKTTTSSMIAWILTYAKLNPGYLIGGVPNNLTVSASLGESPFFVIEADEYDSAFFDKRSKFVHYRPRTAILNNLEYDHADIFPDITAIQTQFHHLVRTVPQNGLIVYPDNEPNIECVLEQGLWTPTERFSIADSSRSASSGAGQAQWWVELLKEDGSHFQFVHKGKKMGEVQWALTGNHNASNAMAAVLAARHAGVTIEVAAQALCEFKSVKRRMELILQQKNGVYVYDDFAHHPTAIATTLNGLRKQVDQSGQPGRILAIIDPASNTMKQGIHQDTLANSSLAADAVLWYQSMALTWDIQAKLNIPKVDSRVFSDLPQMLNAAIEWVRPGDHVVVMSNGGFGGIHQQLVAAFQKKFT